MVISTRRRSTRHLCWDRIPGSHFSAGFTTGTKSTEKKYNLYTPRNWTWNPKMKVFLRCYSFSQGWFSGSVFSFRGGYISIFKKKHVAIPAHWALDVWWKTLIFLRCSLRLAAGACNKCKHRKGSAADGCVHLPLSGHILEGQNSLHQFITIWVEFTMVSTLQQSNII